MHTGCKAAADKVEVVKEAAEDMSRFVVGADREDVLERGLASRAESITKAAIGFI